MYMNVLCGLVIATVLVYNHAATLKNCGSLGERGFFVPTLEMYNLDNSNQKLDKFPVTATNLRLKITLDPKGALQGPTAYNMLLQIEVKGTAVLFGFWKVTSTKDIQCKDASKCEYKHISCSSFLNKFSKDDDYMKAMCIRNADGTSTINPIVRGPTFPKMDTPDVSGSIPSLSAMTIRLRVTIKDASNDAIKACFYKDFPVNMP